MTSTTAENGIDDPSHVEPPAANSPRSKEEDDVALRLSADRVSEVLGKAALDLWSRLPQEVQHQLFERAVLRGHQTEADESLREQLAQFLHDHHERTAAR
jgi:hypothetical protein